MDGGTCKWTWGLRQPRHWADNTKSTWATTLPDFSPADARTVLYDPEAARRMAVSRSHTARGDVEPRLGTGMPWASAMRIAMPVPPVTAAPAVQATTAWTGRSRVSESNIAAFLACGFRTVGEHRFEAGCRAAATSMHGQRRRRQHPTVRPPVPVGSPATAARSSSGRRARPPRTPCRLRPPRRLPDASRSAPTIPPLPSCRPGSPPASRTPRFPHSPVSSCPGPISSTMRPMYQTRLP